MTHTKGNVIVEEIKVGDIHYEVGDIHYEYDMGRSIKCKVLTKPTQNEEGQWTWKSQRVDNGKEIDYMVDPKYPHYSANLYDYEAYGSLLKGE